MLTHILGCVCILLFDVSVASVGARIYESSHSRQTQSKLSKSSASTQAFHSQDTHFIIIKKSPKVKHFPINKSTMRSSAKLNST